MKINNYEELKKLNSGLKANTEGDKNKVIVRIAMATCSIASGSKPILDYFSQTMPGLAQEYKIIPTGCMGLCHSEPTVEVTMPGADPVVFGKVDLKRSKAIVEEFIKGGKRIDGIIGENEYEK